MSRHRAAGSFARHETEHEARALPGFSRFGHQRMRSSRASHGEKFMNTASLPAAGPRTGWILKICLLSCAVLFGVDALALAVSPTAVTVPVGGQAKVTISQASGEIQAESKNTAIVTVALSNRTTTGATLTLYGKSAGSATVYVRDSRTSNLSLPVSVV